MALQAESEPFRAGVLDAIALGSAGHVRNQSLVSRAQLDQANVLTLLAHAGVRNAVVKSRTAVVQQDFVQVQYLIDPKVPRDRTARLDIRIAQVVESNDSALTMMKRHLGSFQQPIAYFVEATSTPFGDCSLQTGYSVFWTHSRHFIMVSCDSTNPGLRVLNNLAAAFESALADADVRPQDLIYPHPELMGSGQVEASQGQVFELKLVDIIDLDPVITVEFQEESLMIQVRDSTDDGAIELFPRQQGSTKVTIITAHKQYLTVGRVEVQVNISAAASQMGRGPPEWEL